MNAPRSITLLHLSDPQFGPKHRFDGTAPGSLFARLRDDFEDMRERHGLVPDLILVTGDLVEHGKPSEFRQFKAFAEATVNFFGLPRRRMAMIPGNHDISRPAAEAYFKECEADERTPRPPYWPKLRHYAAMFAEFYAGEPDITFTEEAPYSLFEYPELGVVVAGLNSTLADSHRAEDHYGFLGEPQLRDFAGKLRQAADQGLLRIGAVHHHPIYPEGDAAKQDLRDLKRILGSLLNLVVHGHIHEDELHWLDSTTPILGVGSAGVKAPQRPEEVPNQYQWIRVSAGQIEYGSRAYVPDQKRWVDDLRPDRDGAHWWQRRAVAFDRVARLSTAAPATPSASDALARAVASHRASMAGQLRTQPLLVDLATYGEDGNIAHRLDLLNIFIPQRTTQEVPRSDRPGDHPARELSEPEEDGVTTETVGPVQMIDAVVTSAAHPWTLVLGTPGAGKTALTMWLALKLCAAGEDLPGLSPDLVPVRVELRRFVERWASAHAQGRSYEFFDYLDDLHREESRALRGGLLRELAAAGRLLWLFDGLDEVANKEHRAAIASMIIGVREAHGGRGVVTGRIVGCRHLQARFHAADVHCFTLLDLSDDQIEDFTARWHVLAFPHAEELGARRRERLRRTLADNPTVRDLCRNPLLLTLVALLNRGDELPRRRHKLIERASDLMIRQWETNKELPTASALHFDPADKLRYLAELAWHMLTELPEGPGNIVEEEALERFTVAFCERHFPASAQTAATYARALIQHLRERNYVLGLLGGTQFSFLHKAFFEYFAAEEAVHRFRSQQWRIGDLKRLFTEHWHVDAWTEVLILICGLLQEDRSEPVIAVIQAVLGSPWLTARISLLNSIVFAVRCLGEIRRLDSGPVHALALALNQHGPRALRALHLRNYSWGHSTLFGHVLATALHQFAETWPGAEQAIAELSAMMNTWRSEDERTAPPHGPDRDMSVAEVVQVIRLSVTADGGTNWRQLAEIRGQLHRLGSADVLHCVEEALLVHSRRPLAAGLYLLSSSAPFVIIIPPVRTHDACVARFMELHKIAMTRDPWVALAYSPHFPDAGRSVRAKLSTPEFAAALAASPIAGLSDGQLSVASHVARTIPGLPWELPSRHLLEHSEDTAPRIDAALLLEDWAWIQQAADTGPDELKAGAQATLDVAESLADVLRAGRMRRAAVRRAGVRVGELVELQGGTTRFSYDREYLARADARAIAPNLPLRAEPFDTPGLHPVFEGLLPQGWMLDIDLRKYRLKSGDQFGLLLATGRHTIGAIEVIPEDEAP